MSSRFQWVWWGWSNWRLRVGYFKYPLSQVYTCYLQVGPAELRKWSPVKSKKPAPGFPKAG